MITYIACDVLEEGKQCGVLELIAHHRHWCVLLVVGMKDCVTSGDQSSGIGHRIERYGEHKALRLNEMLLNGTFVPNLVHGPFVMFAEVVAAFGVFISYSGLSGIAKYIL